MRQFDDPVFAGLLEAAPDAMVCVDSGGRILLAASIAGELQREGPGRRVRFTIQQPAWVQADRILVRTVLRNLLDNAWKFTSGRDDALIEFGRRRPGWPHLLLRARQWRGL